MLALGIYIRWSLVWNDFRVTNVSNNECLADMNYKHKLIKFLKAHTYNFTDYIHK